MYGYVFAYRLERKCDEVFFRFPQLPEIISSVASTDFERMSQEDIQEYAVDAVLTTLQSHIGSKSKIPCYDSQCTGAVGFVNLTVQQSLKIELFKVYRESCKSISDFSKKINRTETAARRMLDLHHQSWVSEIEAAMAALGKRVYADWHVVTEVPQAAPSKPALTSARL
jgi:hypothetical protein